MPVDYGPERFTPYGLHTVSAINPDTGIYEPVAKVGLEVGTQIKETDVELPIQVLVTAPDGSPLEGTPDGMEFSLETYVGNDVTPFGKGILNPVTGEVYGDVDGDWQISQDEQFAALVDPNPEDIDWVDLVDTEKDLDEDAGVVFMDIDDNAIAYDASRGLGSGIDKLVTNGEGYWEGSMLAFRPSLLRIELLIKTGPLVTDGAPRLFTEAKSTARFLSPSLFIWPGFEAYHVAYPLSGRTDFSGGVAENSNTGAFLAEAIA